MASYGVFSTIDAIALRVSRLNANGTPDRGNPLGAYVFCCAGKVSITPNIETGTTLTKTGYCAGQACNSWEVPDRISGFNGELTLCNISDEIQELIGNTEGLSATVNGTPQLIGSLQYENSGACAAAPGDPDGVTIEVWSRPVLCKRQITDSTGTLLWRKKVIPWAYNFILTGTREFGGDQFVDNVYSFKTRPVGPLWLDGPFHTDEELDPAQNPLAPAQLWTDAEYWTTEAPPTCPVGTADYIPIPA